MTSPRPMNVSTRTRRRAALPVLAVAALALAGCGSDDDAAETEADETTAATDEAMESDGASEAGTVTGSLSGDDQSGDGASVQVASATLEGAQDGWVVIHTSSDGAPGPFIGWAQISEGDNSDVTVELNEPIAESQELIPMLHVDDNEIGAYEFMEVEGADAPVTADGAVVIDTLQYTVDG